MYSVVIGIVVMVVLFMVFIDVVLLSLEFNSSFAAFE